LAERSPVHDFRVRALVSGAVAGGLALAGLVMIRVSPGRCDTGSAAVRGLALVIVSAPAGDDAVHAGPGRSGRFAQTSRGDRIAGARPGMPTATVLSQRKGSQPARTGIPGPFGIIELISRTGLPAPWFTRRTVLAGRAAGSGPAANDAGWHVRNRPCPPCRPAAGLLRWGDRHSVAISIAAIPALIAPWLAETRSFTLGPGPMARAGQAV
jgi:hypothetical protein